MKTVALIPARGGSKRLPGKNIKDLGGKPLLAYTIEAALNAESVDRIILSTDDESIAKVALEWGADVPFIRPEHLAQDKTPDRPVLQHALDWLKQNDQQEFDFLVLLRPTSPFKTAKLIDQCVSKLAASDSYSSIRTVTPAEGVFHPYWMFHSEGDCLSPFIDGISLEKYYQSQLLPKCLRLNGLVDVLRTDRILGQGNHWGECIGSVVTEEIDSVDIDNLLDFQFCEFLLSQKKV